MQPSLSVGFDSWWLPGPGHQPSLSSGRNFPQMPLLVFRQLSLRPWNQNLFQDGKVAPGLYPGIQPSVSGSTGSGTSADTSAKSGYLPANYLTIPLFLNIGGMVSEDVGLWFTGGPYMGFLMSQPSNTYGNIGYKNFDLGLDATLTANYVFLYPFSVIFGTTFKYGGLNNLMSSQSVEKITTSNFTFFSGVRFAL